MIRKITLIVILCLIGSSSIALAQKFDWELDASTFIDNAEGTGLNVKTQTLSGAWIAPRVGISIKDTTNGNTHRLMAGFDFTQQFGLPAFGELPKALIYYNYQGARGANHYLGLLPRSALTGNYSRAIFSDSLRYFNHTIQGIALSWRGEHLRGEMFFDWFALDVNAKQEAFMVGGAISANFLQFMTGQANLYYAHNKLSLADIFLRDAAAYNVMVGVDMARFLPLDVLSLDVGVLGSFDRARLSVDNSGEWVSSAGFNARFKVGYKGFLIDDELFVGNGLAVQWGSKYYTEPLYNRAEASWNYNIVLLKKYAIDFKVSLVLHTTTSGSGFSQMATVKVKI